MRAKPFTDAIKYYPESLFLVQKNQRHVSNRAAPQKSHVANITKWKILKKCTLVLY